MKITRKKVSNVIGIDNDFAVLVDIDRKTGDFLYELVYVANQIEAIKQDAITVEISVLGSFPDPEGSIFKTRDGVLTPERIIENIRLRRPVAKDQRRGVNRTVIRRIVSDISTGISNTVAGKISRMARVDAKKLLRTQGQMELVKKDEITRSNRDVPVLQTQITRAPLEDILSFRKASIRSILRDGLDPTRVTQRTSTIASAGRNLAGLAVPNEASRKRLSRESEAISRQLLGTQDDSISKSSRLARGEDKVSVIRKVPMERVEIPVGIRFLERELIDLDSFYVRFRLRTSSGRVITDETRRVSHTKAVNLFNTPRIPPVVNYSPFRKAGRNSIEIRQEDPRAEKVLLYRKVIGSADPTLREVDYDFVGEFQVSRGNGLQKVIDIVNNTKTVIYRVIPVGPENIVGSIFTNVVVPGVETPGINRSRRLLAMSLTARITDEGILIDGSEIPPGPIALKIHRKDLTLFEKEFSIVNDVKPIKIVNESSNVSFLDTSVKRDHIYEYAGILIFEDGDEEISTTGRTMLKYQPLTQNVVDTSVGNPEIISREDEIDVRFSISSRPVQNRLDIVKSALNRQGLLSLYSGDIAEERDFLEKIVTHGVTRIDLTSGEVENLGTFSGEEFSDARAIALASANPLRPGRRYRYVISPQLRAPETLLSRFERTEKNSRDGREYSFSPRKYFNPITLQKGTLVTDTAFLSNHAEDEFSLGAVGSLVELEIDLGSVRPQIEKPRLLKVGRRTLAVRWRLRGDPNALDHFVICRHQLGMKEFVGTVHNVSKSGIFEMLNDIKESGVEFFYSVTPVFDDYELGSSVATNRLST